MPETGSASLLGELRGKLPGKVLGRKAWLDTQARASFFAAATMILASPRVVGSPKDRPLTDEGSGGGRGEEQAGQQMTHFGGGQSNEWRLVGALLRYHVMGVILERDGDQESVSEQDEGEMAIPAQVAAHFLVTLVRGLWRLPDPLRCASGLQWPSP